MTLMVILGGSKLWIRKVLENIIDLSCRQRMQLEDGRCRWLTLRNIIRGRLRRRRVGNIFRATRIPTSALGIKTSKVSRYASRAWLSTIALRSVKTAMIAHLPLVDSRLWSDKLSALQRQLRDIYEHTCRPDMTSDVEPACRSEQRSSSISMKFEFSKHLYTKGEHAHRTSVFSVTLV